MACPILWNLYLFTLTWSLLPSQMILHDMNLGPACFVVSFSLSIPPQDLLPPQAQLVQRQTHHHRLKTLLTSLLPSFPFCFLLLFSRIAIVLWSNSFPKFFLLPPHFFPRFSPNKPHAMSNSVLASASQKTWMDRLTHDFNKLKSKVWGLTEFLWLFLQCLIVRLGVS